MVLSQPGKSKKEVPELPPSSDKEFWGEDARIKLIDKNKLHKFKAKKHYPIFKQGPYFVCKGCPYEHTLPGIDPNKYTVKDGKLVKLDKQVKK